MPHLPPPRKRTSTRRPFATARRTSNTLYGTHRWRQVRAAFLVGKVCARCGSLRKMTVDHDPPHDGTEATFFDASRFVALCKRCHDSKSARYARQLQEDMRR